MEGLMRALTLALALAASAVAGQAAADVFIFETTLDGASEFPPVVSDGFGVAVLRLDTDLHTLRVRVKFEDLEGTTTLAHVHAPTAVANTGTAGVATELPLFTGFPVGVRFGAYDHIFDTTAAATWNPAFVTANGGTTLGAEAAFLAALQAEKAYLNIHTTFVGSGEIRGFPSATGTQSVAIPEPGTWALMIAGFGLAGASLRRRAVAPAQEA
jgi:hypothetical protein